VKKKRWPKVLFLLVAAALIAAWWLAPRGGVEEEYDRDAVRTGTIERYLSFEGSVVAPRSQSFAAPGTAVVRDVYVAEGDPIAEGDRLLKLSTGDVFKSDIDGQVANLFVAADDAVAAGQALVDVVDFSRLEIEIKVDEFDVGAVQPGEIAKVTIDALDKTVDCKILRLDKLATKGNDISYYMARLAFPGDPAALPGMRVGAKVLSERAENVPLVSADALYFDDYNQPYVLVPDGAGVRKAAVAVGVSDGAQCEIREGLAAGDQVLIKKKPAGLVVPEALMRNRQ